MKSLGLFIASMALIAVLVVAFSGSANAGSLPQLVFLGDGPDTYETTLDNFIVKVFHPFGFETEPGPTYQTSKEDARVWGVSGGSAPPSIWEEVVDLGTVEPRCIIRYVGIDDDKDDRRNAFYLDGELVESVSQGMVFSGSFVVEKKGNLKFVAEDSVGGWMEVCDEKVDPTATITPIPTDTPTSTPGPSPTPTNTPLPTDTATPGPSPTPTSTKNPPTLTPTVTPTKRPREHSCTRIDFEVAGQDAARGLYIVQETGGKELATWYALDGWQDSGWFKDIDITHENVYVQVLYYRGPGSEPVVMKILNHAPDSPHGWMSWGICHALEVAWPGEKPEGASVPDAPPSSSDQAAPASAEQPPPPPPPTETPEEDGGSVGGASLNS